MKLKSWVKWGGVSDQDTVCVGIVLSGHTCALCIYVCVHAHAHTHSDCSRPFGAQVLMQSQAWMASEAPPSQPWSWGPAAAMRPAQRSPRSRCGAPVMLWGAILPFRLTLSLSVFL